MNFEVVAEFALLGSVGEPIWLKSVLREEGEHRVRAHFVNTADNQTAETGPVGKQMDAGFGLDFVKRDALTISERCAAELAAGGGDAAFVVAGEREIMRLREKFNAGKELRQERLPVLAPVGLLKLWLEIG